MAGLAAQKSVHSTIAFEITVTTTTAGSAAPATNEVQTVSLTNNGGAIPTGGTFTLTYSGQTTAGIAYNANAATIVAALEALSNIGVGDVAVSGPLTGGSFTVTFQAALAATNVAQMTASGASLTGPCVDVITLSGCHGGILQIRNRATSGASLYYVVYTDNHPSKDAPTVAGNDTYCVPFGQLSALSWSHPHATVKIISDAGQAYSVESFSGLN